MFSWKIKYKSSILNDWKLCVLGIKCEKIERDGFKTFFFFGKKYKYISFGMFVDKMISIFL